MDDLNKQRVEGAIDQAKGNAKEAVGKATDNPDLQQEGAVDQAVGEVKEAAGKAKEAVKDFFDKSKKQ